MTFANGDDGLEPADGDGYATWDAAYVLGALSSAERREYEAHLQNCDRCRTAVAELSGMPALLGLLSAEDAEGVDAELPPLRAEMLPSVLTRVRQRRRRSRWLTTASIAVAAALLAVGLVAAIRPELMGWHGGDTAPVAAQLEMSELAPTPVNATVALTGFAWGTRVDMACTYGQWSGGSDSAPSNLGMVVVGRDGSRTQVATWLGLPGATALPSGNTSTTRDQIAAVQLVYADTGKVLLERRT